MTESYSRKRSVQRKFWLTRDENEILNRKIKASKSPTFQAYAYQMLFQGKVIHNDFSELNRLNFEVGKLGTNVNQLAKAANIYKQVAPEDVQALTTELTELKDQLNQALKQIRKAWSS
ncbi:MobC family plasmid mobilization relaxosome protein [Leuconostocaceae bacterium ESL0958]|nr:MobC family plasmid mobilization relaxosome protein [Leuconostocaceae bacterium ESL0958]